MATTLHAPQAAEVGDFLSSLFGLDVHTVETASPDAKSVHALAEYVDDNGTVRGLIACDLPGAAKLGGALTHLPMGVIEDSLKDGALADNLSENVAEVFNIVVNLFPDCHSHRLVLGSIHVGADAAERFANAGGDTVSYELEIHRYGKGVVAFATP